MALKERVNPKVFNKFIIEHKEPYKAPVEIGYIQKVLYTHGNDLPHIEYSLDKEFRNKGIMSKELPKYIKKYCKPEYSPRLIALVDGDNIPSHKLLDKNGFIPIMESNGITSYILHTGYTKEHLQSTLKQFTKKRSNINKKL